MSLRGSGCGPSTLQSQPTPHIFHTATSTVTVPSVRQLFPLPLLPYPTAPPSTSRRVRQHQARLRSCYDLANDALRAVNTVYLNYPSVASPFASTSSLRSSVPSPAQRRLHTTVLEAACAHFASRRLLRLAAVGGSGRPSPPLSDRIRLSTSLVVGIPPSPSCTATSPRLAASDFHAPPSAPFDLSAAFLAFDYLLDLDGDWTGESVAPSYHSGPTGFPVLPLIAASVALPSQIQHVDLSSCLPSGLAMLYAGPQHLLLPPSEAQQRVSAARLRRPRVLAAPGQYLALVERMATIGMLTFTTSPRCVNGLFGVPKGDDQIRLILDARRANCYFVDPPPVELPSPSHLATLRSVSPAPFYVAKLDLSNFYHQLVLPAWLWPYFALPALSMSDLHCLQRRGVSIQCLTNGHDGDDASVYPCCTTLPMGFSHSVFLAQSVHEHIIYRCSALNPKDNILNLLSPLLDRPVHGCYIDDLFLIGPDRDILDDQFDRVLAAYLACPLPPQNAKLKRPASTVTTLLGVDVDPATGRLALSPGRHRHVVMATLHVLQSPTVSGRELSALLGSWTWQMLLNRPSLAALKHSYHFARRFSDHRRPLWPCVRRELAVLLALAPLLYADITAPDHQLVLATDASAFAAGVVQAPLHADWIRHVWPVMALRECALLPHNELPAPLAYQPAVEYRRDSLSVDHLTRCASTTIGSMTWTTIISSPWRRPAHINELELEAVLLALRAVLSSSHSSGTRRRLHLVTDSSVVYYALRKGRSSSPSLLRLLRRCSALALGGGLSLALVWVPSAVNPADSASRCAPPSLRHSDASRP